MESIAISALQVKQKLTPAFLSAAFFLYIGDIVGTFNSGALPPLDPQQRYSIPEASAYLRQSRSKTYIDIGAGTLAIIKDGKRTYIPGTVIAERSRAQGNF